VAKIRRFEAKKQLNMSKETLSRIGQIEKQALEKILAWLQRHGRKDCLLAYHESLTDFSDQPGFQPTQQMKSRLAILPASNK
jgi:hypothetical protein